MPFKEFEAADPALRTWTATRTGPHLVECWAAGNSGGNTERSDPAGASGSACGCYASKLYLLTIGDIYNVYIGATGICYFSLTDDTHADATVARSFDDPTSKGDVVIPGASGGSGSALRSCGGGGAGTGGKGFLNQMNGFIRNPRPITARPGGNASLVEAIVGVGGVGWGRDTQQIPNASPSYFNLKFGGGHGGIPGTNGKSAPSGGGGGGGAGGDPLNVARNNGGVGGGSRLWIWS